MNAAKETRINFCWSIRTQRLCTLVVRSNPILETKVKNDPIQKWEAEEYIAIAKKYCEKWIKDNLEREDITKRQASAAYRALDKIVAEAEKIKERL